MTYTNADALADLEHAKGVLEPLASKRAAELLARIYKSKADAECVDADIHSFFGETTGVASDPLPKPPRWQFWK